MEIVAVEAKVEAALEGEQTVVAQQEVNWAAVIPAALKVSGAETKVKVVGSRAVTEGMAGAWKEARKEQVGVSTALEEEKQVVTEGRVAAEGELACPMERWEGT